MRLAAVITTLITLLLGGFADVQAAAVQVPRMERVSACSWDRPGHNPFTGDVVAAIDRYIDIPTLVRIKLKQRMQARDYDDLVEIRRDSISGRVRYEPAIHDMHFGVDRVCHEVTRERWTAQMLERGLVYCEAGHCILVPTVCRNVSRIERQPSALAGAQVGMPQNREAVSTPADVGTATILSVTPLTVLAVAPGLAPESSVPIGPSFSEGATGTASPLWQTGSSDGMPSQSADSISWPGGPAAGDTLLIHVSTGANTTGAAIVAGAAHQFPGRGSSAGTTAPNVGTTAGGGAAPFGSGNSNDGGTLAGSGNTGGGDTLDNGIGNGRGGNLNLGALPDGFAGGGPLLTNPIGGGPFLIDPAGGLGDALGPALVAPVPEPSTWASMLTGLVLLAVYLSRRQGRSGAPRCATQKRS